MKNQVIDDFELQKSVATWSFYKSLVLLCEDEASNALADHISDSFQSAMSAMQAQVDAIAQQLAAKTEHCKLLEKTILDKVSVKASAFRFAAED